MSTVPRESNPRLRPIDIRPIDQNGMPALLLRDPLQLCDRYLVVSQLVGPALLLCDGAHDAEQIAARLRTRFGLTVGRELVEELLAGLDEALLLDNARFAAAHEAALAAYRAAPARPPALAGHAYPADAAALRRELDGYLAAVPRQPAAPASGRGLLSPHIDYARGGPIYAQLWQRAAELARAAELVILVGTDHYSPHAITLTRQHYATPLGLLPTAGEAVDALAAAIGPAAAFAGELYHRVEHSLELVAVWLQHMRGGAPVPTVPILVGSFGRFMQGHEPADDPQLRRLVDALRQAMRGRRTLVVASGDLAHVGPAFGGAPLDGDDRADLQRADEAVLARICAGDADGLVRTVAAVGDRNNICGLPPAYVALRLMGAVEGTCTGYEQCPADAAGTSLVSVCGVLFG